MDAAGRARAEGAEGAQVGLRAGVVVGVVGEIGPAPREGVERVDEERRFWERRRVARREARVDGVDEDGAPGRPFEVRRCRARRPLAPLILLRARARR